MSWITASMSTGGCSQKPPSKTMRGRVVRDGPPGHLGDEVGDAPVLALQVVGCVRGARVVGEVEGLAGQVGEVPRPDAARVTGRVADRVRDEQREEVEPPAQRELGGAGEERADEGCDPG